MEFGADIPLKVQKQYCRPRRLLRSVCVWFQTKLQRVVEQFKTYLNKIIPDGFTIKVEYLHGGTPYLLPFESKELDAAKRLFRKHLERFPFQCAVGVVFR